MILRLRFGNARDGFLRDDENVRGSLRVNVVEGQYEVVLVNDVRGYFAGNNFFEQRHATLHDHERELGFLLVFRHNMAQVIDDLVVELL